MAQENNAARIVELIMEKTKMRQSDIAHETKLSEATICRLLADKNYNPQYKTFKKIAELGRAVLKKKEPEEKPPTTQEGSKMNYEKEIDELKSRVLRLEGHVMNLLGESRHPFEKAAPTREKEA